ncbi:MAG: C-terminal binding protein [Candidatus Brocadiaceae bacterium]|nr:C-terminal binding protein [Candidatus Brocadiaceae bacterium]
MADGRLKVVITDLGYASYEPEREELAPTGAELVLAQCADEAQVAAECADADAVITRMAPVGARAIAAMRKCRVISRYGVGVDNVDVAAATARGIPVAHVRDYCNEEVSDQALALLLACVRRISSRDRQVRAGRWDIGAREPVYRIAGKVLGLVGYGAIARTLHRKMAGFEPAEVLVHDAFIPADRIEKAGARAVPLQELLARSDFVSLHVPLTEATRHLIDRDALGTMKPTAILVNTSRGGVVDTDALYEALKAGRIAAAGLDVHEQEPPPPDYKLFDLDNVVLTDHAGWYSEEAQEALQRTTARNVALVLAGGKPLYCVNPEVL